MEALVKPFPMELTTPPVTKICFVIDFREYASKKSGGNTTGLDRTSYHAF